tara:strand:- start:2214 stop:4958 length:2745 start_codon:yes stop_codon:yes gene_type:complete
MTKKDRLSIHVDNGNSESEIYEAVTILRNVGDPSQSGLVGVTNKQRDADDAPIIPDTIFNVQADSELEARFSTHSSTSRSKIELLGNGNQPSSGMVISYQKDSQRSYELAKLGENAAAIEIDGLPGDSIAHDVGKEISFLVHQNGTTAIGSINSRGAGLIDQDGQSLQSLNGIDTNSALQVSLSGYPKRSGTLSLREQSDSPLAATNYGKVYVKPYEVGTQTQALYFADDGGNEFNLVASTLDSTNGNLYGNQYGNTFGGWYTPRSRGESSKTLRNTYLGHGIDVGIDFKPASSDNTIIGYHAGSGLKQGKQNTIVGSNSFTQSSPSDGNIVLGYKNLTLSDPLSDSREMVNNTIIIGNNLYVDNYPPDYLFAVGQETPLITGQLKGSSRTVAILASDSEDTRFAVEKGDYDYNLGHMFDNSRHTVTFGSQDKVSTLQTRSMMSMRFLNSIGHSQTLMDYDPSGLIPITPTWESPTFKRPTVSISGDLRVLGDVRFNDGTSLNSIANFRKYYGLEVSGIKRMLIGTSYYLGLDFDNVKLASELTSPIVADESYVAVDVADGLGKMSLTALGNYVTAGSASFSDNCNALFTNPGNTIKSALNSHSVFIGCDVATNATGWKHGVFIGTNAGLDSTTTNGSLSSDTACTYIGYMAGHTASNTDNAIFIGSSAGKNADSSTKSIFIGPGAGENSTNPNSIGIGAHALGGEISDSEGGSRNIELVAGLDDNQRLLYTSGELSDTLNIQNSIAGNTKTPSISIGKATLTPSAPLEVIRHTTDTNYSLGHTDINIQKWINNTSGVARVNSSGSFIRRNSGGPDVNHQTEPDAKCDSWFGTHEGIMTEYIYAPTSFTSPVSGWMRTRSYENGFLDDRLLLVTSRDTTLNIHGPGAVGGAAYVITMMVNGEHRPIYVSCSGTS